MRRDFALSRVFPSDDAGADDETGLTTWTIDSQFECRRGSATNFAVIAELLVVSSPQ